MKTYTIRRQDTISPSWGIYLGKVLVDGGFSSPAAARDYLHREYRVFILSDDSDGLTIAG